MPKGTYAKRGRVATDNKPGLMYMKDPGGTLRRLDTDTRKQQGYKEDSNTVAQRIARSYIGSQNIKGDSADKRIAENKAKKKDILDYVKRTRNK